MDTSARIGRRRTLQSRFLLGTAGYPSPQVLRDAIAASGSAGGHRRASSAQLAQPAGDNGFIARSIRASGARLLPNTAGCRTAREAVTLAHMARELFDTHWIKLEVVGDEHTLQPDPFELVEAAGAAGEGRLRGLPLLHRRPGDAASACSMPAAAS